MNRLENKVAVVTGANSGVGAAIAKLFAAEGAVVVMTARREAALEEVAGQIEAAGGKTFVMATDISKAEDPERLMAAVEEKYGKIDVLVNNAGILESGLKPVDRFTDEDLDRIIETNQKGTMRCMRAATKRMVRRRLHREHRLRCRREGLRRRGLRLDQGRRHRRDQAHRPAFPGRRASGATPSAPVRS